MVRWKSKWVSIPLESGHIVMNIRWELVLRYRIISFNPLRIGSYCNIKWVSGKPLTPCFNPLRIGSYCNSASRKRNPTPKGGFNPLRIGSYCNEPKMAMTKIVVNGFNPLRIGSYCNISNQNMVRYLDSGFQSP